MLDLVFEGSCVYLEDDFERDMCYLSHQFEYLKEMLKKNKKYNNELFLGEIFKVIGIDLPVSSVLKQLQHVLIVKNEDALDRMYDSIDIYEDKIRMAIDLDEFELFKASVI